MTANKAAVAVREEVVETRTSARSTLRRVNHVAKTIRPSLRVPQVARVVVVMSVPVVEEANMVADMAHVSVALHTMSETFVQLFLALV